MTSFDVIILGIVEGLTEFLPISSTGHLILTSHFLKIGDDERTKALEIIIQSGAMFAVIWHYRSYLMKMMRAGLPLVTKPQMILSQKTRTALPAEARMLLAVGLAFLPSAVTGLLFRKWIKAHLFGVEPVIVALILGGLAMIAIERWLKKKHPKSFGADSAGDDGTLNLKQALWVGIFQCFALWPGMSRSMTTILGARIVGLSPMHAAAFSFLLAIPTLIGATVLDLYKSREMLSSGDTTFAFHLALGTVVSFIVALIVIRAFLDFLKKRGLEVFAWYRLIVGAALWIYLR